VEQLLAWLGDASHANEFLRIYINHFFDAQAAAGWNTLLTNLISTTGFKAFTPADLEAWRNASPENAAAGWPSTEQLVQGSYRVMFIADTRSDAVKAAFSLAFGDELQGIDDRVAVHSFLPSPACADSRKQADYPPANERTLDFAEVQGDNAIVVVPPLPGVTTEPLVFDGTLGGADLLTVAKAVDGVSKATM